MTTTVCRLACNRRLCLFLLPLVVACGDPLGSEEGELEQMWARWTDTGITDYSYRFQRLCFCGSVDPVIVEVRDRDVISIVDAVTGEPVDPPSSDYYLSIDGIFSAIQNAVIMEAHSLTATYHSTLGYPTSVDIDYRENVIDEEVSFRASDVEER